MTDENEEHGFRRIGDHVPPASSMRLIEGSTRTPLPRLSPTGGERPREQTPSSGIGTRPGGRGVAIRSSEDIAAVMARGNPEATDAAILALLPPSVGSALSPVEREFIDPQYGWDCEIFRLSDE